MIQGAENTGNQSVEFFCISVCKSIADESREQLKRLYATPDLELLKRSEQSALVQYAIDLPLLAQKKVESAFASSRIDGKALLYTNTAWKEISEQIPSISYEYVNWKVNIKSIEEEIRQSYRRMSSPEQSYSNQVNTRQLSRKNRIKLKIGQQLQNVFSIMPDNDTIHKEAVRRGKEILKNRIEEVHNHNDNCIDAWCEQLKCVMIPIIKKYLTQS